MKHQETIIYEGIPFIAGSFLGVLIAYNFKCNYLSVIFMAITIFCIIFFRNPNRKTNVNKDYIISPADGRIQDITLVNKEEYIQGEAIRVRIFLNLFNVHINRMPVDGHIEWIKRVSGSFISAYKEEASLKNQRNYIGIRSNNKKILVVQITGLIARRLVCWVKAGEHIPQGERIGLIKFGSCTEIYIPVNAKVQVKVGDKVKGGETIIAEY
jgi:phosphatidylserine decarboxylase